jgi:hypothetical protein
MAFGALRYYGFNPADVTGQFGLFMLARTAKTSRSAPELLPAGDDRGPNRFYSHIIVNGSG